MLCYAMLCYIVFCYVMRCRVVLHYIMLCDVMLCIVCDFLLNFFLAGWTHLHRKLMIKVILMNILERLKWLIGLFEIVIELFGPPFRITLKPSVAGFWGRALPSPFQAKALLGDDGGFTDGVWPSPAARCILRRGGLARNQAQPPVTLFISPSLSWTTQSGVATTLPFEINFEMGPTKTIFTPPPGQSDFVTPGVVLMHNSAPITERFSPVNSGNGRWQKVRDTEILQRNTPALCVVRGGLLFGGLFFVRCVKWQLLDSQNRISSTKWWKCFGIRREALKEFWCFGNPKKCDLGVWVGQENVRR